MSDRDRARAAGYAAADALVAAIAASVPRSREGYSAAHWRENAYDAAVAVVNGAHRAAFEDTCEEWRKARPA